jgi:hypothetical protein
MPPRKASSLLAVLALLAVPALSGCASNEPSLASAAAHSGMLGGIVDQLKEEDDAVDARESIEHAPQTREEVEEAREQAEQATLEAAPEPEGESG